MIDRPIDRRKITQLIEQFPVTVIVGARQTGKTTLARQFHADYYFDLENPRDLVRLDNPQLTLEDLQGLIVIDEIQRRPEIFPVLRYLVDKNPKQKYLILGSASRDLIKQSSETLAGRIAYFKLEGFRLSDIGPKNRKKLWLRGGLPPSFLANSDQQSFVWRQHYITAFLERDLPQLGIRIPAQTLRRFWMMLSHYHGQILNYSEIGRSFGISDMTVRKYVEILEGTFMIKTLWPWHANLKKRLVKRPKLYFQDSGLFHALMSIETMEQLMGHPKLGASWEGFALNTFCRILQKEESEYFFWATHAGAELDLYWQQGGNNFGAEFKFTDAPTLTKSMKIAMEDLNLDFLYVIYPGKTSYRLSDNVLVVAFEELEQRIMNNE
ncbi:MAG: ATP-binding protein [Calditrichaeota bacterium]|nr:ATP-binding protein [Calditrichota bacterium]